MESLYFILFVCYGSYAYNRKSVSLAMPKLLEEGLDTSHAGLIITCQYVAFTITKFLAGIMSDRMNPLFLFSCGLLISGASTVLFSYSTSVPLFCGLWFLNGLAQGCGWPSCAKVLRQRAPPSQFGTLWSVLSSSYNISGTLAPFLSAFVILNFGWRYSVLIAGVISVLFGLYLMFSLWTAPKPDAGRPSQNAKRPTGNKEEISVSPASEVRGNIYDLLQDPFIWLVSACFMVVFCAKTTVVDWGQIYLMGEKKHSQYTASVFTSCVESGGFVGRILAGYLTDMAIRREIFTSNKPEAKSKGNIRMSVAILFMLGSLICIHIFQFAIVESSSIISITALGMVMGMCFYGPIAIYGIVSSESAPSYLSGTSNALASLAANVGATISALPFSYIAKYYKWSKVFFILEVATTIIIIAMFCCRNLKPRLTEHEKKK